MAGDSSWTCHQIIRVVLHGFFLAQDLSRNRGRKELTAVESDVRSNLIRRALADSCSGPFYQYRAGFLPPHSVTASQWSCRQWSQDQTAASRRVATAELCWLPQLFILFIIIMTTKHTHTMGLDCTSHSCGWLNLARRRRSDSRRRGAPETAAWRRSGGGLETASHRRIRNPPARSPGSQGGGGGGGGAIDLNARIAHAVPSQR